MAVKDFRQVERELKKLDRQIGNLTEEDRRLRERIAAMTGVASPGFWASAGTSGEIIAGVGLLGGGALPGTVTLNVYPGDGVEIVSDQVSVDLAATSGLSFASGELQIDDSLAGAGLVISSKILAVGEGHGVDVTADAVDVDESELDHALLGGVLANQHHDAVTLHADLDSNLLALSIQALDLDTQAANLMFAGPTTGGAVKPTFRAMVVDDLVAHTHSHDTDLTDVSANDHHNQQHVLTGGDHTASGLTIGWVIRASGAATFAWAELQHGDLGGVGASDHHDPVTAGDGIDLSVQQVSVDVTDIIDTAYGLTENANDIRLNIGDGLEFDAGALEVDLHVTWCGLEFDAGDLRVDLDVAFTWTGTHTFQADIQAECNLDFVGAQSVTTTADNLTLAPAADLLLNPGGNDVIFTWGAGKALSSSDYASQTTGWGISHGSSGGHADFRSMYADELHVQAFIADIYQASIGAIIITKSRGRLSRDFTIPANSSSGTLYIEDLEGWENIQLFTASDVVRLRYVDTSGGGLIVTDVWGVVTVYTDLAGGEQSYTFTTTDDGGVSGSIIYAGAIALDYGQTGSGSRGVWEATVLDAAGAPYSQIATWETNPWTGGNWTTRVRLGNLDGISGIGLEYGLWAGQNMTDTFLLLSDSSFEVHGLDVKLYDGASNTVRLDPATPSVALGSTLPTGFGIGDGIWMGKDTVYKFRAGDVDGERLAWDGSDLYLYADDDNYIKATGSDLEFWSNATKTMWLDGDTGALFIDKMGDMLFSEAGGLLLLGPPLRIEKESSVNYWHSTRKQKATITGALHLEAGRWLGTQALLAEIATTNLYTNPSGETNTTGWAGSSATLTRSTDQARFGDYSFKLVSTVNGSFIFYDSTTPKANPGQGEIYTVSFWIFAPTAIVGETAQVAIRETGGAAAWGTTTANFTLRAGWQRVLATRTIVENDRTGADASVRVLAGIIGDIFYADGCQFEEQPCATSVAIGDMGDGYAWTNGAHASTSTRAATVVNLDAHVGLISGNDTMSFRVVAQMPYDYDGEWPTASWNYLFDTRGANNNNRISLYYSNVPNEFRVYINGSERITNTGVLNFKAGDWIEFVLTLDFTNDEYYLYINGALVGSATTSLAAPTLTAWRLGTWYFDAGQYGNFTFSEYAVLDAILTAAEGAQLHNLQRPLVDAGSTDKPGIYLIDGQFRLVSSQTGTRTEINSAGIFGEDGDGAPTFTLLNEDTTVNSEALTAGDVLLGDNTASRTNLLWDESAGKLLLRVGTTVYTELSPAGVLTLGLTSAEHAIINTSGMTIKDGATTLANFSSTVTVGEVGASKSSVYITAGAVQLRTNTTAFAELTAAGVLLLGDDATGEYIQVASNGIRMYSQGSTRVRLDNAGTFWAGDSAVTERLQWDTTNGLQLFNASNTAVIKFGTSGDALITGKLLSAASPAARIEIDDNYIAGYSDATTKEFYLDASDGKAYAAGGKIVLDSDTFIKLYDTTPTLRGKIGWVDALGWESAKLELWASDGTDTAQIFLYGDVGKVAIGGDLGGTDSWLAVGGSSLRYRSAPSGIGTGYFEVDNSGHGCFAGGLYIGDVQGSPSTGAFHFVERSSDPAEPAEGRAVIWMSDGTGKGDDGDVLIASKAGGATKYATLFDHSSGGAW